MFEHARKMCMIWCCGSQSALRNETHWRQILAPPRIQTAAPWEDGEIPRVGFSNISRNNIRRIRPLLTQKAPQVLVQALVISRLDFCNSLLAGLPARGIRPLQLIQNTAARLVCNQPKFTHTTSLPSLVTSGCPYPLSTVQQNHDCLLSWLLNDGMSSSMTSGQQKVYTSAAAN